MSAERPVAASRHLLMDGGRTARILSAASDLAVRDISDRQGLVTNRRSLGSLGAARVGVACAPWFVMAAARTVPAGRWSHEAHQVPGLSVGPRPRRPGDRGGAWWEQLAGGGP